MQGPIWMFLVCSTMKEDLETLLALERANIIANYTQARPAGSPRDPWEDAELSLCRLTDHHGFLQEKEMPGPSPHEAKQLRQETRRADKWVKMLRNWEHYWVSKKMHRRVYKRVPLQVWGQVWTLLLDIEKVKSTNQGVYEKMKEQAQLFSRDIRQIDLDVNRTFRNHVMFRDHYGVRVVVTHSGQWKTRTPEKGQAVDTEEEAGQLGGVGRRGIVDKLEFISITNLPSAKTPFREQGGKLQSGREIWNGTSNAGPLQSEDKPLCDGTHDPAHSGHKT
ncbi:TBC1 domain family member 28-like isoform X5 [Halichoerus grypus]